MDCESTISQKKTKGQCYGLWFSSKKMIFFRSENGEHFDSLISEPNIWQNGFQDVAVSNKKV